MTSFESLKAQVSALRSRIDAQPYKKCNAAIVATCDWFEERITEAEAAAVEEDAVLAEKFKAVWKSLSLIEFDPEAPPAEVAKYVPSGRMFWEAIKALESRKSKVQEG
jgi:hypothetical protein